MQETEQGREGERKEGGREGSYSSGRFSLSGFVCCVICCCLLLLFVVAVLVVCCVELIGRNRLE